MKKIIKTTTLLICCALILSSTNGCNNDVSNNNEIVAKTGTVNDVVTTSSNEDIKTTPVNTETLEFIYSLKDGDDFDLEVVNENSLFYLAANDFIDLCNIINKKDKKIESLDYGSLNKETMELTVIYRSKVNSYTNPLGAAITEAGLAFENVEYIGEDKQVIIKLNDQVIKPIIKEGQQYIPINYINYVVIPGQPYLLRTDENIYDLSSYRFAMGQSEESSGYIDPDYSDYKLALLVLDEYLFLNYGQYQRFDIPDSIESYPEYFLIMFQMCDSLKDYHFTCFGDQVLLDKLNEYGWKDIYYQSNVYNRKTFETNIDLSNEVEWLSNNCLYIPFRTFGEIEEFSKLDEVLINDAEKLSNQINVVIDLRNNPGGTFSPVYMFLQRFMKDAIVVQVSNNHQNEMFGSAKYTIKLKLSSQKEKNYSFTVIVNEKSASGAVAAASILKDNFDANIIGREPMFKKTENLEYLQLPDGTMITLTRPDYSLLNKDGIRVDDSILVDQTMTDEEVDEFLEGLRD